MEAPALIEEYLRGELTLDDLHGRLAAGSWGTPRDPVTSKALLRIAEFTNGDWSEEELREHLDGILRGRSTTGLRISTAKNVRIKSAAARPDPSFGAKDLVTPQHG